MGESGETGVEIRHKLQEKPTRRFLGIQIPKKQKCHVQSEKMTGREVREKKRFP